VSSFELKPEVRVILVGRTGLDAKLRLDQQVELVRARTPLDAVGELADPIGEPSIHRTVVIVGEPADGGHRLPHPEASQDLVRGLRLVDPDVKVYRTAWTGAPDRADPFDSVVHGDMDAEHLRAMIHDTDLPEPKPVRRDPSPERSLAPEPRFAERAGPQRVDEPNLSSPAEHAAPADGDGLAGGELGDEAVVRALLRGDDVAIVALQVLRRRTGDRDLSFTRHGGASAPGAPGAGLVAFDDRVMGTLSSSRLPAAAIGRAATWLASWLRLAEQQVQLREAAFTDPLTGAWNRRYFDRFLTTAIDAARAARRNVTVLVFDIDNFKHFNDSYGHEAGDDILREAVRLLRSVIRPSDRVCRIGGDEFAVIFNEPQGPRDAASKHPSDVSQIAERFQRQILEARFPKLGAMAPGTLTVSGGLATFPWDGATPESLLRRADELALASKRSGKNVITIGPGLDRAAHDEPVV
jgi:diguanylate cyclase (GGDEF)-like protein